MGTTASEETPAYPPSVFAQPAGNPTGLAPSATNLARIAEERRNMPLADKRREWERRKETRRKQDIVTCKVCKVDLRKDGLKKHEKTAGHLAKLREKKKRAALRAKGGKKKKKTTTKKKKTKKRK